MSPNLGQSLERAHRSARDQSHRLVTLEHLLLALIEDSEASIILQSANVDLTRLGTDVSGYLGGLLEDMRAEPGTEPRPDSELLRVLQAAASAAQQSKRKQIDGAIVLAAVVGDGKSPAAGLLKALGMTFEEAIRALQRANAKARLKPIPKAEAASPVEPTRPVPAASPPPPKEPATAADPAADDLDILDPPSAEPVKPLMPQSADEILAAARARIQQRTSTASKPEPEPLQTPAAPRMPLAERATDADPATAEPIDPVHTKSLTAAIEAVMSHAPGRKTEPETRVEPPSLAAQSDGESDQTRGQSSPEPPARAGDRVRAGWIPPPEANGRSEAAEMPAAVRAPLPPFPARPLRPNEGPRRPPLPQRLPAAGQPGRAARAPWPKPGEPGASSAPSLANGANADGAPHVLER
ncbi:MAG TPA: Clp protease N-terminal domain-containing protein, partial [Hyphomicrobiaceae bacterium]|nr:Clp protease N-terminal domain-containing protein [Hyphomicrobiaceae bacterium]